MNSELAKLQDWFTANKLTINTKKSNFVVFHPSRTKQKLQVNIKLTDYITSKFIYLEQKDYVKYLGVLLDNKHSWKPHIDYISNKVSRIVSILSELRHSLPKDSLLKYTNYFCNHCSYNGINIWGQASKTIQDKLQLLQKRALRSTFFTNSTHSVIPLFIETDILPVILLYFYSTAQSVYDVTYNFAPTNISKLFTRVKDIHNYDNYEPNNIEMYSKTRIKNKWLKNTTKYYTHKNKFSLTNEKMFSYKN